MTRNNFMGEVSIDLGPLMACRAIEGWYDLCDPEEVAEVEVRGKVYLKAKWNDECLPMEATVSQFELFTRRCKREETKIETAVKDGLTAMLPPQLMSRASLIGPRWLRSKDVLESMNDSMARLCSANARPGCENRPLTSSHDSQSRFGREWTKSSGCEELPDTGETPRRHINTSAFAEGGRSISMIFDRVTSPTPHGLDVSQDMPSPRRRLAALSLLAAPSLFSSPIAGGRACQF